MPKNNSLEKINLKDVKREMDVGLIGAVICVKYFGSLIAKRKNGGIIINIASDLSVISPNQSIYRNGEFKPVTYSVIKHGLIGLTKYVSTFWPKKNVRCNALSPGPILDKQSSSFLKKLKKQIPLERLAYKNEYRSAIKFMCSDDSSYLNGHNLIMDGGRSVW
jgi:NAD(P)-dependent dehydrogenase (short-subunit alcohol dehydrogenase family)